LTTPTDAYRQGYEKAKSDTLGGIAAEVTLGMIRDDPGGYFANGYRDGAAGKPFTPPITHNASKHKRLIPNFSENPFGWLLAILFLVELWALWQLLKAPFKLIGAISRGERPSTGMVVTSTILAVIVIALTLLGVQVNRHNQSTHSSYLPTPTVSNVQPVVHDGESRVVSRAKDPSGKATEALVGVVLEDIDSEVGHLIAKGANPNVHYKGRPILLVAIDYCGLKITKALLDGGAKADIKDSNGQTALSLASKCQNSQEFAQSLKSHGAR
jgi:hypothetical protein